MADREKTPRRRSRVPVEEDHRPPDPETLARRRHPLAKCEECPLFTEGVGYVPSLLPRQSARLAVVGEAPGFYEAVHGIPFTGQTGRLLDLVLSHHGYQRGEVLYTNATSCRPQGNETPPKAALHACHDRLVAELRESHAPVVLALGGTAAETLLPGRKKITALRVGLPKISPYLGDTPVIPTLHPAFCLRTPDAFPSFTTDVAKIDRPHVEAWKPPDWRAFEDPDVTLQVVEALDEFDPLVIDIETDVEKDVTNDHPERYQMLCIGIGYQKGKAVVIGEQALKDARVVDALARLFKRKRLIAHNGKYDMAGLHPIMGKVDLWFDTLLAHFALDERTGRELHSLEVLAVELLGTPNWKRSISTYLKGSPAGRGYSNIPRSILYQYNAYDIACTWDLYELFSQQLGAGDPDPDPDWPYPSLPQRSLRDVHDFMVRASNQLMYLELNGITLDEEYTNQLGEKYKERIADSEAHIEDITGERINPRSPMQITRYLEEHGVEVDSTNVETLTELVEKCGDPGVVKFCQEIMENRKLAKKYGTYVKGYQKRVYKGRIYTNYLLHGATSGRLSSRSPNLQNVQADPEIKRQFVVSDSENIFVHCDYKQAEARVIAWLAQEEYFRNIFLDADRDIFAEISDDLYGPGNWGKLERRKTKTLVYGLAYGREAKSIAKAFNMTVFEAQQNLDAFMSLIPNVVEWQKNIKHRVLEGKDLITPFGRRRRFYLITDQNRTDVLNEALSYIPQSTASDICLSALTRLRPLLEDIGQIRLTIHDAIVVETRHSRADEVAALMQQVMAEEGSRLTDYVPFSTDVSFGTSWADL